MGHVQVKRILWLGQKQHARSGKSIGGALLSPHIHEGRAHVVQVRHASSRGARAVLEILNQLILECLLLSSCAYCPGGHLEVLRTQGLAGLLHPLHIIHELINVNAIPVTVQKVIEILVSKEKNGTKRGECRAISKVEICMGELQNYDLKNK